MQVIQRLTGGWYAHTIDGMNDAITQAESMHLKVAIDEPQSYK